MLRKKNLLLKAALVVIILSVGMLILNRPGGAAVGVLIGGAIGLMAIVVDRKARRTR